MTSQTQADKLPRRGVIIIGSNSARMLTANLDASLSRPVRSRRETRLFLRLQNGQQDKEEARRILIEDIRALQQEALDAGAEALSLYATAALRDEGDIRPIQQALFEATGLYLRVISGRQEAAWSFLGAAYPYKGQSLGVVDIGGGSTELALGRAVASSVPDGGCPFLESALPVLSFAHSLQVGAARLHSMHPIQSARHISPAKEAVLKVLRENLPPLPFLPSRFLLVGGTGYALVGLMQKRMPPAFLREDLPFALQDAQEALERLAALPPRERLILPGMTPGREHILPTGLVIAITFMEHLGIRRMVVTQRNNTDGALLFSNPYSENNA